MLTRIVAKLKRDGLLKTLVLLRKKLVRVQRHLVYVAACADAMEPDWLPGDWVSFASRYSPLDHLVSEQLLSHSADNVDYLEAVSRGEAEVLAVLCDGNVIHYAFLLYRNKMVQFLGFSKKIGLVANAYTIEQYRGRGYHTRSVAARIKMAERSGFDQVLSETAYDNVASQHGLVKGGMKFLGRVEFVVLFNVLVIRYRKPNNSIKWVELCW